MFITFVRAGGERADTFLAFSVKRAQNSHFVTCSGLNVQPVLNTRLPRSYDSPPHNLLTFSTLFKLICKYKFLWKQLFN